MDPVKTANKLLGLKIVSECHESSGGNSRVYRLKAADGNWYALKSYPPSPEGNRLRMERELSAYNFFEENAIGAVPKLVTSDLALNCAVFGWVEGTSVQGISTRDMNEGAEFLAAISVGTEKSGGNCKHSASEACFSPLDLITLVTARMSKLVEVMERYPSLKNFLHRELSWRLVKYSDELVDGYAKLGCSLNEEVTGLTLCPADFGWHNAIRTDAGLVFIDFEYFGWDDPVKFLIDVELHPKNDISSKNRLALARRYVKIYRRDEQFPLRYQLYYRLQLVRWCTIMLNDYISEKWKVRPYTATESRDEMLKTQLTKAEAYLHQRLSVADMMSKVGHDG